MAHQISNNNSTAPSLPRRSSIAKAPPKPPPMSPNLSMNTDNQIRDRLYRYETLYKQTKNQLEGLRSQYNSVEKQLLKLQSQKNMIESNHSNIINYQKKIANLELENQTLIDKNGLFLQQKNTYLLQLADVQQKCDELQIETDNKTLHITKLENEIASLSQNYTQQLHKKDTKYKQLKNEYMALNKQYIENQKRNQLDKEELDSMAMKFKEIKQEHILLNDKYEKLESKHNELQTEYETLQTEITQVKGDTDMTLQLAQKKDKNIIKDLRQTLKTEAMKTQRIRAEYLQLKDELNDLRDWRENYLRQQKLQQTQQNDSNHDGAVAVATSNSSNKPSIVSPINANMNELDASETASTTSSTSNATASSSKSNRNRISTTNKLKIHIHKTKKKIKSMSMTKLPSIETLILHEFNGSNADECDEKVPVNNGSNDNNDGNDNNDVVSKEHDEFIEGLSNRLAIVKENYINLKSVVQSKDKEIERLNYELNKNKEMISDLIEKVNDKPLPPTPIEMNEYELNRQRFREQQKIFQHLQRNGLTSLDDGSGDNMLGNITIEPPPIPAVKPPRLPMVSPKYSHKNSGHIQKVPSIEPRVLSPNNQSSKPWDDTEEEEDIVLGDGI